MDMHSHDLQLTWIRIERSHLQKITILGCQPTYNSLQPSSWSGLLTHLTTRVCAVFERQTRVESEFNSGWKRRVKGV